MIKSQNVMTSEEYLSTHLSPQLEISPWPKYNIKKEKYVEDIIDYDHFEEDSLAIKSAFNHVMQYNFPQNYQEEEQVNEIIDEEKNFLYEEEEDECEEGLDEQDEDPRIKLMRQSKDPIRELPICFPDLNQSFQKLIIENKDKLLSLEYYQEQIYFVLELTEGKRQRDIAQLFQIRPGTVFNHSKRMKSVKQPVGAPCLLTDEEREDVSQYIHESFTNKDLPTIHTVLHYIYCKYNKLIDSDSIVKLLKRYKITVSILAKPIDSNRFIVDVEDIKEYYSRLKSFLQYHKVPDSMMINTDESGFQPYANAKPEYILVPPEHKNQKDTYYPVKRQVKRSTLIASVVADGTILDNMIIVSRKTIELELYYYGYRPQNGYYYVSQDNAFMTKEIWDHWAETILFPAVKQKRIEYQYSGPIVLLLDGCCAHLSDFFLEESLYLGIVIFFEPPNSSDQLQVLDISLFGIQKKIIKRIHPNKNLSEQSEQIVKIINSWKSAAQPSNIVSAFEQAGFSKYSIEDQLYMSADINNAIRVRGINSSPIIHGEELKKRVPVDYFE